MQQSTAAGRAAVWAIVIAACYLALVYVIRVVPSGGYRPGALLERAPRCSDSAVLS